MVVVATVTTLTATETAIVATAQAPRPNVTASAFATLLLRPSPVLVFARPGQEVPSAPPVLWVQEVFRGLPAITAR